MRSVTFNFRPDVPRERQNQVLKGITSWETIHKVSRLNPRARVPLLLCMAYAYLEDDADLDQVVERLRGLPEIESAGAPPRRGLVR
jgi:hypothetical protein